MRVAQLVDALERARIGVLSQLVREACVSDHGQDVPLHLWPVADETGFKTRRRILDSVDHDLPPLPTVTAGRRCGGCGTTEAAVENYGFERSGVPLAGADSSFQSTTHKRTRRERWQLRNRDWLESRGSWWRSVPASALDATRASATTSRPPLRLALLAGGCSAPCQVPSASLRRRLSGWPSTPVPSWDRRRWSLWRSRRSTTRWRPWAPRSRPTTSSASRARCRRRRRPAPRSRSFRRPSRLPRTFSRTRRGSTSRRPCACSRRQRRRRSRAAAVTATAPATRALTAHLMARPLRAQPVRAPTRSPWAQLL